MKYERVNRRGRLIEFLYSEEDFEIVNSRSWNTDRHGYAIASTLINGKKTTVKLHRLILGLTDPKIVCDHINGDTTDNRRENLRECTMRLNARNIKTHKSNKSGHTGVFWDKTRKLWRTYLEVDLKRVFLGRFKTKEESIAARKEAEIKYFGEFRRGGL